MNNRINTLKAGLFFVFALLIARFFYWQILSGDKLEALAQTQRTSTRIIPGERGKIITSDGFALVSNTPTFMSYAYLPQLEKDPQTISQLLAPLLTSTKDLDATESAKPPEQRIQETYSQVLGKLTNTDSSWVSLRRNLGKEVKKNIDQLNIEGLGFDSDTTRFYPEASASAHLLGFVGRDNQGDPQGYFGLEGYYNLEIRGKASIIHQEKDASGNPIIIGDYDQRPGRKGRDLVLNLNRGLQHTLEKHLSKGLERYSAKAGEVIVMDPYTGAILAMASLPTYDPRSFTDFDTNLYKNPAISSTYEPGSTFKVLSIAAALEEEAIKPDTICDEPCQGPVTIGKFTIGTWDNQYHPGQNITDILKHSDNTGMIFIAQELGKDKFVDYIKNFGIGEPTGIDLQEETSPSLRKKWGDIDLATASFGQGLAVTGIQMIRAVAVIANGGNLVEPHVVSEVIGEKTIKINPKITRNVISEETAKTVTNMMVTAVKQGESKWIAPRDYNIAGKTGTAQIPVSGHYDEEKTIASFIGFAPAEKPKFIMLVKLTEPQSSPWASETAAPLFFTIAEDVMLHLNVPPSN